MNAALAGVKPNEGSKLKAMAWAVPGLGGGALGVPPPPVDDDEDPDEDEPDEDEPEDGVGRVASFGLPTRLRVLAAESSRIICWRSCSSRAAERLPGIAATAAAVGSVPPPSLVLATKTPAAMATTAVIVVTRRKLIRPRLRRLA